jgi:hypothetical protein
MNKEYFIPYSSVPYCYLLKYPKVFKADKQCIYILVNLHHNSGNHVN